MSLSDCERCWDTPCGCEGSAESYAVVLRKYGFVVADSRKDPQAERDLARFEALLKAWGCRGQ